MLALAGCATQQANSVTGANASTSAKTPEHALIGSWEEYAPSSNFVHFGVDGSVKLSLKPGEVGPLRLLQGTWKFEKDGWLRIRFVVQGSSIDHRLRASFPGGELVLQQPNGTQTKHRRHSGELPEAYAW